MNKKIAIGLLLAMSALGANATPISWSITGPGIDTVTVSGLTSTAKWTDSGYSGQWTISATAPTAGNYSFNYDYSGLYSWFMVRSGLSTSTGATLVNAGPKNGGQGAPSGGFDYTGSYTFSNMQQGQVMSFIATGSNYDYSKILDGQLVLSPSTPAAVPEPANLALMVAGLGFVGVIARRKKN